MLSADCIRSLSLFICEWSPSERAYAICPSIIIIYLALFLRPIPPQSALPPFHFQLLSALALLEDSTT